MKRLPMPPSVNERVLAQEYHESFTGLTTDTITLAYVPIRTVNDVGLELVFKNGTLISGSGAGASSATRETFTDITDPDFTLANKPVVGSELVFRNGELLDDRAAKTANVSVAVFDQAVERFTGSTGNITLAHAPITSTTLVAKNGTVLDPSSDYTVAGTTLTVSGRASPDIIVVHYSYAANATQTLTVDPAPGSYTIDADGKITPDVAPDPAAVFTVFYEYGGAGTDGASAGYTINGNTLTLATALVESDTVEIWYPYRNN